MSAQIIEERVQSPVTEQGHHRRPGIWQRVHQTVSEMNYASRRIVEVQAPWINGDQSR